MLAIYTRISKDRDNQISTEIQKEKGIELAKKLGIGYKLFEEEKGTSGGKKIEDRPQLNNLVNEIYDNEITAVYFYNQDRSSRDEVTWFTLANTLVDNNIQLYENGNLVNLNDEDTYMLSGFKAIMDANFRRKTSKKVKDAHLKLLTSGKATSPVNTYGYKKDKDGYIVVDEEEAKIIKRIFKESLSGKGSLRISNDFNKEGIKTRYAKNGKGTLRAVNNHTKIVTIKNKSDVIWSPNTIMQIIKSTWYYGKRTVKKKTYDVPPIITYDYWLKVNDALIDKTHCSGLKTNQYLLKGILKCSCGHFMYGRVIEKKRENFYRCASKRALGVSCGTPSINRPYLDEIIWNRFFASDTLINLVVEHFQSTDDKQMIINLNERLTTLKSQLNGIDNQKNNTITFASKNIITPVELESQLKRIRNEKNQIEIQILNIEEQLQTYHNTIKSSDSIVNELNNNLEYSSYNDIEVLIHKYIRKITVDYDHNHYIVQVDFNLNNINSYYLIIHRRFYYAIEPFTNDVRVINKFQQIKQGKEVDRTDEQFINDVFGKKQSNEVLNITKELVIERYKDNLEYAILTDNKEEETRLLKLIK